MRIRLYEPADLQALRRICLLTGDSGRGAESLYKNPDLLGDFYAAPYSVLDPELTFVLVDEAAGESEPIGYVLGTADSATFGQRCEQEWFPQLRKQLTMPVDNDPSKDARMLRKIFEGHRCVNRFPEFPAHLHIDLLPQAQGSGWGRRMLDRFTQALRDQDVVGVHLGVGKSNTNAIGFYKHYGFQLLEEEEQSFYFGLRL